MSCILGTGILGRVPGVVWGRVSWVGYSWDGYSGSGTRGSLGKRSKHRSVGAQIGDPAEHSQEAVSSLDLGSTASKRCVVAGQLVVG